VTSNTHTKMHKQEQKKEETKAVFYNFYSSEYFSGYNKKIIIYEVLN